MFSKFTLSHKDHEMIQTRIVFIVLQLQIRDSIFVSLHSGICTNTSCFVRKVLHDKWSKESQHIHSLKLREIRLAVKTLLPLLSIKIYFYHRQEHLTLVDAFVFIWKEIFCHIYGQRSLKNLARVHIICFSKYVLLELLIF